MHYCDCTSADAYIKWCIISHSMVGTADIEVSRLAIGFQKVCNVQTQFWVVYSTPTGSILFKQHFHKSCETYQLTNE